MSKLALTALIAAAGIAGAVQAAPASAPAASAPRSCFFITDWDGWSAPDNQTLLLKVNRDVYRLTVRGKSSSINSPGMYLISQVRGSSSICSARDLDLTVADSTGFREYLFLDNMTKLSSDEVAALPKKDRP